MDALHDATLESPWYERLIVVGIVALAHLMLFVFWLAQPEPPMVAVNEMSISFANVQMQQADVAPQPEIKPKPKLEPKPRVVEPEAPQSSAEPVEELATPPVETPPSPVQLDAEPDYRADYLNNPRPPYPLVARRMGYQGKVVLNVEVLAEGWAGEVKLQSSSGYDILDKAAMQTVKTWKFSPATRFGQPITKRFLVPIKFSLEE
jgi:protein TonB